MSRVGVIAGVVQEAATAGVEAPGGWPAGVATDWVGLGLALALTGSFFLGTALFSTSPRELIEERFGLRRPGLRAIREPVFQRVQLGLGFAFLMAGFGVQLFGRAREVAAPAGEAADALPSGASLPAFWIGAVVITALVLWAVGGWWARVSFRRALRAAFLKRPPEFEADMDLAREVGELYGVAPHAEDTVQSFVARLRHEAGLPARRAGTAAEPSSGVPHDPDGHGHDGDEDFGPFPSDAARARRIAR